MALIKQSSSYTRSFLMVGTSDHITGQGAASPKLNISQAGGALSSTNAVIAELGVGLYTIALTSTDTRTLGDLAYHLTGTSADPTDFVDQVVAFDPTDAVRLGLTALPNVAAAANGGLPTVDANNAVKIQSGTGANQISLASGLVSLNSSQTVQVGTNNDKSGYLLNSSQTTVTIGFVNTLNGLSAAALANFLNLSTGTSTATAQSVVAGVWDILLSGHLSAGSTGLALNSAGAAGDPWSTAIPGAYGAGTAGNIVGNNLDLKISSRMSSAQTVVVGTNNDKTGYSLNSSQTTVTIGAVNSVVNGVTVSTNNDKTGYSLTQSFPANFASLAITGGGAVTVGTNNDKSGYALNSSQTTVTIGTVNTVTGTVTVGTNNDKTGYALTAQDKGAIVASAQTTLMTESYAAKAAAPSFAQILFEMRSHLTEKAINQTSVSLYQLDGATIWGTATLDSTSPTQIHRSA